LPVDGNVRLRATGLRAGAEAAMAAGLTRDQWAVLGFTLAYVGGFLVWFLAAGNAEFVWYIITMVALIGLIGLTLGKARYPTALLWALSLWGLAHMAGGGVPVGDSVLYAVQVVPIGGTGEMTLLKYDQLVHAYGFGVTAWLLWHLMDLHFPFLRGTWTILVYPALGTMGLGAVNEMIEFAAVLALAETGVGGYYNTALDLVFNGLGAVIAMMIIARAGRRAGA
jgi:putative membrane protein